MAKILVVGLRNAGKSSILQKAYEEIEQQPENPFKDHILKIKSLQKLLKIQFQEEEADWIDNLSEDQRVELYSNVRQLIWIIDISDQSTVSTSQFYWKKCIKGLNKYSKFAKKILCFHKIDLLPQEGREVLFNSVQNDFELEASKNNISIYKTSLNDHQLFQMISSCLKTIHEASFEIKQIQNQVDQFLHTNDDFFGATILSSDGLPVIELGEYVEFVSLPANLWLGTNDRLKEAFNTKNIACTIHLDNQTLIFFDIGSDLLLTTIAKKEAPLQFSFIRSDLLAKDLQEILFNVEE